jgi:anoctamin-10
MPIVSGVLHQIAIRLTDFENYETDGEYKSALTQKLFVMDLVTSYLGIILTAFVYIPFACILVPYLDVFSLTVKPFVKHHDQQHLEADRFKIDRNRLKSQVISFTLTAQIVNFCLELVVPYVMRSGARKAKQLHTIFSLHHGGACPDVAEIDDETEEPFLERVRKEAKLAKYDVFVDIREMVIQVWGYILRMARFTNKYSLAISRSLALSGPSLLSAFLSITGLNLGLMRSKSLWECRGLYLVAPILLDRGSIPLPF